MKSIRKTKENQEKSESEDHKNRMRYKSASPGLIINNERDALPPSPEA